MGRPRNIEGEDAIYRIGCRLMLEHGYAATSYQAIAEASGQSRALVQHYLPKKELLLERFIGQMLDYLDAQAVAARPDADLYENFARTGQLYFAFLRDERSRPLALEMLASRDASLSVIEANSAYQHAKSVEAAQDDGGLADEIVRIIGGAYESIYRRLKDDGEIDPAEESARIVSAYAALVGDDRDAVMRRVLADAFTEDETGRILDRFYAEFASE